MYRCFKDSKRIHVFVVVQVFYLTIVVTSLRSKFYGTVILLSDIICLLHCFLRKYLSVSCCDQLQKSLYHYMHLTYNNIVLSISHNRTFWQVVLPWQSVLYYGWEGVLFFSKCMTNEKIDRVYYVHFVSTHYIIYKTPSFCIYKKCITSSVLALDADRENKFLKVDQHSINLFFCIHLNLI